MFFLPSCSISGKVCMSGKWSGKEKRAQSLAVLAMAWVTTLPFPATAGAFDSLWALTTPFQDPLRTVPERLQTGATLPGDGAPVPCPTKGFATPLALGEAVDLALCNNPQIKAAWANIKVQAAAVGEARAADWPTLSGTVGRINDQTRYPGSGFGSSTIHSNTVNGSMSWRIFDFGGREANREAANHGLTAALANHDAVIQKILAEVIQAYFDAQTAKAAWQAKEQNEDIARSTLDTAKRREAKGAGARSDTLQATTALARATLDKNRAQGAYQKALSVLIYAIGSPTYMPVTLADDLGAGASQAVNDLNAWLEETQKKHPAIMAARAQLKAAQYRVTATRSDGLPTIDFSANYFENGRPGQSLTPTQTRERTLGIALTIPIFDGFSRTYKVRGAEAQVEQRGAELQDTEHQILMEVVKAHADAAAALENLQASEALLTAAQDSLSVSKRKYEKGATDILEILNTQTALSDAQQERIRSLAEWRSARLRLLANAGQMGRIAESP
jgi:outer membrane protein